MLLVLQDVVMLADRLLFDCPSARAMIGLTSSSSLSSLKFSGLAWAKAPCKIAKDAESLKNFMMLIDID